MTRLALCCVLTTAFAVAAEGVCRAQGPTKVCVVNVERIFKDYVKTKWFEEEFRKELAPLKAEFEKTKKLRDGHAAYLAKSEGKDAKQDEISAAAIRDADKFLNELDERSRKFGKRQQVQHELIHKEIRASVETYAQQKGFCIVLSYCNNVEDAFAPKQNRTLPILDRSVLLPYYVQEGFDITDDVLARLNQIPRFTLPKNAEGAAP